ncbi:MAG: arsenite methyltransferase [Planctomycetota bacterium]
MRESVRVGYAAIARSGQWSGVGPGAEPSEGVASLGGLEIVSGSGCCGGGAEDQVGDGGGGGCCGPTTLTADQVAVAVGYGESDLAGLPAGSNMGLSCGNPTALASLEPGEVVVDLGSGGGFDCFIAGPRVGAAGRVIGVDMTPEMLSKARSNVSAYRERTGLDNVEFRLGEIENLPVADGSADVVISNCVLNLSPEKRRVWREIARVLRVGGRAAVSDLALVRPLPAAVVADVEALVGCVAGAVLVDEVRSAAEAAGLERIEIVAKPEYVEAMTSFEDPLYRKIASSLGDGERVSDYVVSVDVSAVKAG